jgi:type II secretory pathway pseudopilin PulG
MNTHALHNSARRGARHRRGDGRSGFTIIEIVMAFIIIGILISVLIPTLSNRADEARRTAALQDLERLADAQERVAVDTGYFFRIYALNDTRGGDNLYANAQLGGFQVLGNRQGIQDNDLVTNNIYERPTDLFILPSTQNYPASQIAIWNRLDTRNGSAPNNETDFNWNGPYLNWYRDTNRNDWPDDPWGNDYLFFTINGLIFPPDPTSEIPGRDQETSTVGSFQFSLLGPGYELTGPGGGLTQFPATSLFDRPTFLTLGPNGVPGNGSDDPSDPNYGYGRGDDLVRSFGGASR